jgi:mono/diheme cytochrome c family protein
MSRSSQGACWVGLLASLVLVSCTQKMANQPRYDPFEPSSFFADGQSARQPVPDTVARGQLRDDAALYTGKNGDLALSELPFPLTRDLLERGQQRFDIYCAVCHGEAGYGDGMIVRRGFSPPPSLHSDRLRAAPVGHYVEIMTTGFGAMPSYAAQVPARDRWAIAAYIRALQLSQHAGMSDLTPADRQALEEAP